MSYTGILNDDTKNVILVAERVDGKRLFKEYPQDHSFYVKHKSGTFKSIFNEPLKKITPSTKDEKRKLLRSTYGATKAYESDIKPVMRCLEQNYRDVDPPKLQTAFFDIEVDYDQERGYSSPENAFNKITAISVYLQWINRVICISIPPSSMSMEQAEKIAEEVGDTLIVKTEYELLDTFLTIIEDADVLSGWNSENYDIPYVINRIVKVMGKSEVRRLCLWGKMPIKKDVTMGSAVSTSYDLVGRVHLDYMVIYKKYTFGERPSYKLDTIAEIEVKEKKVEYEGTLDELYNSDYKRFLEYNLKDTLLLDKLDKKLQYIDLASSIAHSACVPIPTVLGAVATTEQAITMKAHDMGFIVMDRDGSEDKEVRCAGAWVANPKVGLHDWVGSSDINSLYPSTIRALNMSNETIIGQIRLTQTNKHIAEFIATKPPKAQKNAFAEFWNDKFHVEEMQYFFDRDIATRLIVDLEDGSTLEVTGAELYDIVFEKNSNLCISGNGTLFRTDVQGVIPSILTEWYSNRKKFQKIEDDYAKLKSTNGIEITKANEISKVDFSKHADNVNKKAIFSSAELLRRDSLDDISELVEYMAIHDLELKNNLVIGRDQPFVADREQYWDKKEQTLKLLLNSTYGSLLNAGSRYFDQRLGQSTTLTGRCITRHMASKTNELITGEYDIKGESIIAGDTDSTYFTAYPTLKPLIDAGQLEWTPEAVISLYDNISDEVSDTFPDFLKKTFNVPKSSSVGVLKSGREIVASKALFIIKKRYAAMMIDKDGFRQDVDGKPGKIKAMGLDLKRSDTPKLVQDFLSDILKDVLTDKTEDYVIEKIREFKKVFFGKNPWEKGSPKGIKGLTTYMQKEAEHKMNIQAGVRSKKPNIPGHVQAAMNYNKVLDFYGDKRAARIVDGSKIIVCKLKQPNDYNFTSIAYSTDEKKLPEWFLSLPFDDNEMEATIVDKKVKNLIGCLKWKLHKATTKYQFMEDAYGYIEDDEDEEDDDNDEEMLDIVEEI